MICYDEFQDFPDPRTNGRSTLEELRRTAADLSDQALACPLRHLDAEAVQVRGVEELPDLAGMPGTAGLGSHQRERVLLAAETVGLLRRVTGTGRVVSAKCRSSAQDRSGPDWMIGGAVRPGWIRI
ncbi:hypothetical protein GCM10014719_68870 [Planomonospora parontospora subsp. antibiotica]|nr:hypothetical protein GCM10014719_68870 [Planomonospora parontospora subsp. antibiotica]GII19253.1 hypothetical protein Ppa05_59790 [Planomonospora parontospora subsp. antibiotica]